MLLANNEKLNEQNFLHPFLDLNRRKHLIIVLYACLSDYATKKEIAAALEHGFAALERIAGLAHTPELQALNQWTYHSRMYRAAQYVTTQPDFQLVQLVSFGCGIDAITTDEVRRILEQGGKLYTQLKID